MPKSTKINPIKQLEHAEAHCKFGSNADNTIREAEPAAKNKNIMLFITQIGRLKGEQLENSAS